MKKTVQTRIDAAKYAKLELIGEMRNWSAAMILRVAVDEYIKKESKDLDEWLLLVDPDKLFLRNK